MPKQRNLLVVRAGDKSVHRGWLKGRTRNFDLMISYYGKNTDKYRDDADYYHVKSGPRWPAHDEICRTHAALIAQYDYICFACDDLEANTQTWNNLFRYCRHYSMDLAQPAIRGFVSYELTSPHRGCLLRHTNFVEIMCPVFSQAAFQLLNHTFSESVSGWGLEVAWWAHLKAAGRVGIIDRVQVRHQQPVGKGSLSGVLGSMGVDPWSEHIALQQKYEIMEYVPQETGRVMTPVHRIVRNIAPGFYR